MKSNKVKIKKQAKKVPVSSETSNDVLNDTPLVKIPANNKKTAITIAFGICIALVIAGIYYSKGFIVAATVNGKPISRLSVIKQLEKQGGKSILDNLITESLIQNEAQNKGVAVQDQEIDNEIKKIEATVTQQGGALDDVLLQQGMTREALKENIKTQKLVEKLLEDKLQVSDEEVNTYISENKATIPEGEEEQTKSKIKEQLKQQKLQGEASAWIESLRTNANIQYFVNY